MKYILILISLFFISCNVQQCFGQFKIGSITIPEKIAKEYFADCYLRPDTISSESEYGLPDNWGIEQNRLIKERNESLRNKSIGQLRDFIFIKYLIPRKPSEIDFVKWLNSKK